MKVAELEGLKRYVREGSPALNVMDYVGDPIDKMLKVCNEDDLTIKLSHPQENANDDDSLNTAYGRVIVEAKVPNYNVLDSGLTMGFVYALDRQVPEFRTYIGYSVFACTNLCISADEDVSSFRDNHKAAHSQISEYLTFIDKEKEKYIDFHNNLQKELSLEDLDTTIGHVIRRAMKDYKQIGTSAVVSGYKNIITPGTQYTMKNDFTNLWNVYNAITDVYSKKYINNTGLFERPVKTKDLSKLFLELCSTSN